MLNKTAVERTRDYFVHHNYPLVNQEVAGRRLEYFLLPQSLNPNLPKFAVAVVSEDKMHHIFGVADTVPEAYRQFWALHEHIEYLEEKDGPDRCVNSLNMELEAVPPEARVDYIGTRLDFFRDLIEYTRKHSEGISNLPETIAKYGKSLSRLEQLAAEAA